MHKQKELKELAAEIQSHLAKMQSILNPPQNAREKELAGILNVQRGDLTFIQELLEDLNGGCAGREIGCCQTPESTPSWRVR